MREIFAPVAWFLCIVGSTEYAGWRVTQPIGFDTSATYAMPAAWERRYYRRSATAGWEVAVLRKGTRSKEWMVLAPDGSVRALEISHRSTCRTSPDGFPGPQLDFTPLPVMSDERRQQAMEAANAQVSRGHVEALPLYGSSAQPAVRMRRILSVFGSMPVVSARWVRWGLRSRARFAAMGVVGFLAYEALEVLGVFDRFQYGYQSIRDSYSHFRGRVIENYDGVAEWVSALEDLYEAVREYIEPWRLVSYAFCIYVLAWACRDIQEELPSRTSSPRSSADPSPASTPPSSPRTQAMDSGMKAISEGFLKQQEILSRMAADQAKLHERLVDLAQERRAQQLLHEAGAPEANNQGSLLTELKNRLDSFEEVLRKDRDPGGAVPSTGPDQAAGRATSSGLPPDALGVAPQPTTATTSLVTPVAAPPHQPAHAPPVPENLAAVISKLKKSAETPQEIFVKCLEEFKPEDPEEWSRQFPAGYRQRVAPSFLGEVYSQGHSAKHWAKQFIKERELGDYADARDLIPAMAAIDALILQDKAPNVINSVALERLAKKGYAVYQACRGVYSEKDWRRPKDAKKDWKSKIDFVLWRRLDPSRLQDDEQVFVNRLVEDEIRTEMDRDAALLKARQKLEERGGASEAI